MTAECWVAVFTKQGAEKSAYVAVQALNFSAFYPVELIRVRHRDGERYVMTKALFHQYVFVKSDPSRLHEVCEAEGVMDVLRNNGRPVRIPEELIDALRRAAGMGAFNRGFSQNGLNEGDSVKIIDGPFAGLIGKIKRARRSFNRMEIVVDFIHHLDVPVDKLERLSA